MPRTSEDWSYFRAGGVVQVDLNQPEDLLKLGELDQKLWMALAMPTRGLGVDQRTLDALDTDLDGRIRPPELMAGIAWYKDRCHDMEALVKGRSELRCEDLASTHLQELFQKLVRILGKPEQSSLCLADIDQAFALLSQEIFNGDGVIVPASSSTPEVAALIGDLVTTYGGVPDRSGALGIDKGQFELFLGDREALLGWYREGQQLLSHPQVDLLLAAIAAWRSVAPKIEDYFTRCRWVDFDPRAVAAANRNEGDFGEIGKSLLDCQHSALNQLPLSHVEANRPLTLNRGLNPAWREAINAFCERCLNPLFPELKEELTEDQWKKVCHQLHVYASWEQRKPKTPLGSWPQEKLLTFTEVQKAHIESLMADDQAQEHLYSELKQILHLVLFRRDFGRILRNFVNFSDFYRGQSALFQVGQLFLDGRRMDLCIEVNNPAKHASLAGLAGAYLLYCDCNRPGLAPRQIVALLTDGSSDNIMVGRNGVFYDSEGKDWDATVTRIVSNPISLREAFWYPYKSLAKFIEEQVSKRAGVAQNLAQGDLIKTAEVIAHAEKKEATETAQTKSKFDAGTVAAIGVALGSIGTFLGVIFSKFIDLGVFMPFGILSLLLLISGPSVLLAWIKLRHRNLAPILDANGWAINTSARINVPFASSMTRLRTLPLRAGSALPDPYAEVSRPWRLYLALGFMVFLFCLWGLGKCDRILPEKLRIATVLPPEGAK